MHNLAKLGKFLETYNPPKLNQKESENFNRPITTNEIETVIKRLPTNKSLAFHGYTGEFYHTFKGVLKLTLLKLF